jgi:hypothetical protein
LFRFRGRNGSSARNEIDYFRRLPTENRTL